MHGGTDTWINNVALTHLYYGESDVASLVENLPSGLGGDWVSDGQMEAFTISP